MAVLALTFVLGGGNLPAQTIPVPNSSFESQSGQGLPFGVNINIDSWQKADRPVWFPESGYNGFFWVQTTGAFVDTNPYANRDGVQAGYVLPFPGAGLFQDYNTTDWNATTPTHDFDAMFEVGNAYTLTVGVYGKNMVEQSTPESNPLLQLSLYYRDVRNNRVTVASTPIAYSAVTFPVASPLNLVDFAVNVPEVRASDAWAGQHIGIGIESLTGDGTGNWDFDNVRLTAVPVPEPAALRMVVFGFGGAVLVSRRFRHRIQRNCFAKG